MWESIEEFWTKYDGIFFACLFSLLIVVVFWVVASLLRRKISPALLKKVDEQKHPIANQLVQGFSRPVIFFFKIGGVILALLLLSLWLQNAPLPAGFLGFLTWLAPVLYTTLRILIVIIFTWGLVASSNITFLFLRRARHKLDLHMSRSVSRFITALFSVLVIVIAAIIILEELNFDVKALIAGLGIGGLTIALAAKDSAANFFGGLVLIMEKPFEIGDWVSCADAEGTVEDITLRSTKIRTSPGALTIVPNANISDANITNWSGGMEKRRADFTLGLTYGTPRQKIRDFTSAVRHMLEDDPEIISDSVVVRFSALADSSLSIRVIFYTSLPGFSDHLRICERVNFSLLQLAEENDVEYAFPTQEVYLRQPPPQADSAAQHKTKKRKQQPVKVVIDGAGGNPENPPPKKTPDEKSTT